MIQINREVFKERRSDVLRNGTYQSERTCHPDSDRIGDTTSGSEAHSESFRTSESPDSCGVMADRAMGDSGRKGRFDATLLRASVGNSVFSHCPTVDRLRKVTVDSRSQGPATLRADRACVRSVLNVKSVCQGWSEPAIQSQSQGSDRLSALRALAGRSCGPWLGRCIFDRFTCHWSQDDRPPFPPRLPGHISHAAQRSQKAGFAAALHRVVGGTVAHWHRGSDRDTIVIRMP